LTNNEAMDAVMSSPDRRIQIRNFAVKLKSVPGLTM
jgi:hypothetical protein